MTDSPQTDVDDAIESVESHLKSIVENPADGSQGLTENEWEELRDSIVTVGDCVEHSSPGELLRSARFENHPETVEYSDLPKRLDEASPESILRLRKILELGNLAEEQSDLSNSQLRRRLEDILTLGSADEEESQLEASLFEPLFTESSATTTEELSEATTEGSSNGEETNAEDSSNGEETDAEDSSDRNPMSLEEFSDSIGRLRETILGDENETTEDDRRDEAVEDDDNEEESTEGDDEDKTADDDSDSGTGTREPPARSRLSTVPPQRRADMNAVPTFSPHKGK